MSTLPDLGPDPWDNRISSAVAERKKYEPSWLSSLAFAQGKQHLAWDRNQRRLYLPDQLPGRARYSVNLLTQYRNTALGELSSDDERPQLLFRRDDIMAQDYAEQANRALSYGWDHEWRGDDALRETRRWAIDLGTAAMRCRFDKTAGEVVADLPHQNGTPMFDLEQARSYVADQAAQGQSANVATVHAGAIRWEPLSPFNILVPPGCDHEDQFPWEIIVRPYSLSALEEEYNITGLKPDSDIGSVMGLTSANVSQAGTQAAGSPAHLDGHVWLYTCYERPTKRYPKGRVTLKAGAQKRTVQEIPELPYCSPDGTWRSGVTYFHLWRVSGRFWSEGIINPAKDTARAYNKRREQSQEIIDRGLPKVHVAEGSVKRKPKGLIMEIIEHEKGSDRPIIDGGIGPGDYMYREQETILADLERVIGVRGVSLGENPQGVTTYSQLALLRENDQIKWKPTRAEHQAAKARLVEDTVYDMRRYWGPNRQITIAGETDELEAIEFNATEIPAFYLCRIPAGAAKPTTQGAELQLIRDVMEAATASGQPLPIEWFVESNKAGALQPLPPSPTSFHADKAERENVKITDGAELDVAYYDPVEIHVPIHREAQDEADMSGDLALWQRLEDHVNRHLDVAARAQAEALAQAQMRAAQNTPQLPQQLQPQQPPQAATPSTPTKQ